MNGWLSSLLGGFRLRDWLAAAIDLSIVYYVVYRALLLIKGTRAAQILIGLVLIGLGFFTAKTFELTTVTWLLDHLINYAIIFFIVIFQADIRRGLMRVGQNLFGRGRKYEETYVFEEIVKAAERLAVGRIGALIVLERDADLVDYLNEPGVPIEAKVTEELLVALFLPEAENKLHDGAVIIKNLRLAQAGAVLPLTANPRVDKALGTRHRAAIGITEETDAVVIVVSEERGSIGLCFGGNIAHNLDAPSLRKALLGLFQKKRERQTRQQRPNVAPEATTKAAVEQATPKTSEPTMTTKTTTPAPSVAAHETDAKPAVVDGDVPSATREAKEPKAAS